METIIMEIVNMYELMSQESKEKFIQYLNTEVFLDQNQTKNYSSDSLDDSSSKSLCAYPLKF